MKMKTIFGLEAADMTENEARLTPDQTTTTFLDCAPRRTYVEVVEVPRGRRAGRVLAQVGILLHERLRVRSAAPMGGPILVDAGGATIAIGRGLASRIRVRLLNKGSNE
jgi:Fe2+ transport system protein FeoA